MVENPPELHPEGLTENQEMLADLLFDTKTEAPTNRRRTLSNGKVEFVKRSRPTSPIDFAISEVRDGMEEEFALKIHETDPEAPLSPIYINLRELPDNVLDQFGVVLSEMDMGEAENPDLCAGIPKAGMPLVKSYSRHSRIQNEDIFEKKESKGERQIVGKEGIKGGGRKLRLIDDLATGGQTKLEAIEAAELMGFEVADVTVLVDRQQGAREDLEKKGYTLRAAFTLDQLLRYGLRTERITDEQYKEVEEYIKEAS